MRYVVLALAMSFIVAACVDIPDLSGVGGFFTLPTEVISVSGTVMNPSGVGIEAIGVFLQDDSLPGYGLDTVFTDSQGHYSTGSIAVLTETCRGHSLIFFEGLSQQSAKVPNCNSYTINITWNPGG